MTENNASVRVIETYSKSIAFHLPYKWTMVNFIK